MSFMFWSFMFPLRRAKVLTVVALLLLCLLATFNSLRAYLPRTNAEHLHRNVSSRYGNRFALSDFLLPPRTISMNDVIPVRTSDGQDVSLGHGMFGEVKLVYYRVKGVFAAQKSVRPEKRDAFFGETMYQEAALPELIRREGGVTYECYGMVDNYTAVFELIVVPPLQQVDGRWQAAFLPTTPTVVANESDGSAVVLVPPDMRLRGSSVYTVVTSGGSLSEGLKERRDALTPVDWLRICCQFAATLAILHAHQIIHRDVKVDNMFLRWPEPDSPDEVRRVIGGVLADFTLSGVYSSRKYNFGKPKPEHMLNKPPELRDGYGVCNEENDVWHMGKEFGVVYKKTSVGSVRQLKTVIDRMMADVPAERPTAAWVRDALLVLLPDTQAHLCLRPPTAQTTRWHWLATWG